MTDARPRRSALYMPASNARAIEKARTLGCDVVILDLEDAVAPEEKDAARANAVAAVRAGGFGPREVVIRINGLDTPWGHADPKRHARAWIELLRHPSKPSARARPHHRRGADRLALGSAWNPLGDPYYRTSTRLARHIGHRLVHGDAEIDML